METLVLPHHYRPTPGCSLRIWRVERRGWGGQTGRLVTDPFLTPFAGWIMTAMPTLIAYTLHQVRRDPVDAHASIQLNCPLRSGFRAPVSARYFRAGAERQSATG